MSSKAESSTKESKTFRRLGLRLSDNHWGGFVALDSPSRLANPQRVSRIGLRLTDSHFDDLSQQDHISGKDSKIEVSKWSSDSENDESDSDISEEDEFLQETMEERLERHRKFFRGEPLMRCLKYEEARYHEWIDSLFYGNLCHEVQHKVHETRRSDVVREYWKDVREKLAIDDSEIYTSGLTTTPEFEQETLLPFPHSTSVIKSSRGWKRPINMSSSGKDLDLQAIRNFWTDKKKTLEKAKTFSSVEGQEPGDNTSTLFAKEDLGRAATFG